MFACSIYFIATINSTNPLTYIKSAKNAFYSKPILYSEKRKCLPNIKRLLILFKIFMESFWHLTLYSDEVSIKVLEK